jgi:glutathione S-transferase
VALKLYVVHGSHPCAAVEKALHMKNLQYGVWEWPPPLQAPMQKLMFGKRTVPSLRSGSEKITGSRAIMHRLDEMVPEPRLYPEDPAQRAAVEEADRWGDEEFQQDARDLIWAAMVHRPDAMVSYSVHSRIPLPAPAIRLSAPMIARGGRRLNRTGDDKARTRLSELPAKLDKIDAWIADGTIAGPEHPNAATLQILSTVRLMMTLADTGAVLGDRPCTDAARALWPYWDGAMPAGALRAA